jgi:hypothetical protein
MSKNVELEKAKYLIPTNESNPALHFQYRYNFDFPTVAAAFLRKYNWEERGHLTTITEVQ